jgi:hypothetical protein
MKKIALSLSVCLLYFLLPAGKTRAQFPWPVTPFHESHEVTGTFCEFRDTGSADHFHNGTDIPKADGSPVYPVKDGIVTSIGAVSVYGSNAYVRVQDMAYVHIKPNPALQVGDSVFASQTVIGTIYPGMGHVHFTNGYIGQEKNSMLEGTGLTPLVDTWAPIIRYIRFFKNGSAVEFVSGKVSGLVDIVVKVDEQNGPPSSPVSRRNNGTYKIGYRIWNADTSAVVYEPPTGGWRFQFDRKPRNAYVHNVYFDRFSSTTSHVYIVTNDVERDRYWNTTQMQAGKYVVEVFAEDTRGNLARRFTAVEVLPSDTEPPAAPVLRVVRSTQEGLYISWYPNQESDLAGYRLYFSRDNQKWSLAFREDQLNPAVTDTVFPVHAQTPIYFRLTAVDRAPIPNESLPSNVYGTCAGQGGKVLIVDGTETETSHDFAAAYGQALASLAFGFDCAASAAVADSTVHLPDYAAVVWFTGTAKGLPFDSTQQVLLGRFVAGGGALLVSGAAVARGLDPDAGLPWASSKSEEFLHTVFHVDFAGLQTGSFLLRGVSGTAFAGQEFEFGQRPYRADTTDILQPFGRGALSCLLYSGSGGAAAVQYRSAGSDSGNVIVLAIPFETIDQETSRNEVMAAAMAFLLPALEAEQPGGQVPLRFALLPNYPNPFQSVTFIRFSLARRSRVRITVFDLHGRTVDRLLDATKDPGVHRLSWNPASRGLASGLYFVRLETIPEGTQGHRRASVRPLLFIK